MSTNSENMAKAKPFIKWVGGKGQLIEQLDALLPSDFDKLEDVTSNIDDYVHTEKRKNKKVDRFDPDTDSIG